VVAGTNFASPEVSHFPGSFFDGVAKPSLQRRAMEQWPGPSQIVAIWQRGELDDREKEAILLGASASHDPALLPLYLAAVASENPRLRMAAAYGYRDLLGDGLPDVAAGIDPAAAKRLASEIEAVRETLRARPLVEFWLQAALMNEDASLPGWRGVVIRRSTGICFRALEKIVVFDDFHRLAVAYRLAGDRATKVSLMSLLEAVAIQDFLVVPSDGTTGWGARDINEGFEATDAFLDHWLDQRCSSDPRQILTASFKALGVQGVDPLSPDAWEVWVQLLFRGTPPWRMMASRQLYQLGGRWAQLSLFGSESKAQIKARDDLLTWYRMQPAHLLNRQGR